MPVVFLRTIPFRILSRQAIFRHIDLFLDQQSFRQIGTVNAEFMMLAEKDSSFLSVLRRCELNVVDGFGVFLALLFQKRKKLSRVSGADLTVYLFEQAQQKNLRVFCVVREDGLSKWKDVRKSLLDRYPKLSVSGSDIDGDVTNAACLSFAMRESILQSHIVLCNFGAPNQEHFLDSLRSNPGLIRLTMGVGGSFDFLTGAKPRAPLWMRNCGIEWLWRLILQPKRWKRIVNAVILFPLLIIRKWHSYD